MKRVFSMLLLLFFIATTGVTNAQISDITGAKKQKTSDLKAPVPIDKNVRLVKMDNGLTYYLRVNKKPEGRIQFRLVTNAGSILEDDSQTRVGPFLRAHGF